MALNDIYSLPTFISVQFNVLKKLIKEFFWSLKNFKKIIKVIFLYII